MEKKPKRILLLNSDVLGSEILAMLYEQSAKDNVVILHEMPTEQDAEEIDKIIDVQNLLLEEERYKVNNRVASEISLSIESIKKDLFEPKSYISKKGRNKHHWLKNRKLNKRKK